MTHLDIGIWRCKRATPCLRRPRASPAGRKPPGRSQARGLFYDLTASQDALRLILIRYKPYRAGRGSSPVRLLPASQTAYAKARKWRI